MNQTLSNSRRPEIRWARLAVALGVVALGPAFASEEMQTAPVTSSLEARIADLRQEIWQVEWGLPEEVHDAAAVASGVEQVVGRIRAALGHVRVESRRFEPRVTGRLRSELREAESEVMRLSRLGAEIRSGSRARAVPAEIRSMERADCESAFALGSQSARGEMRERVWLRLSVSGSGPLLRVDTPGFEPLRIDAYPSCPAPGEAPVAAVEGQGRAALDLRQQAERVSEAFVRLSFARGAKGSFRLEQSAEAGAIEGRAVRGGSLLPVSEVWVEAWTMPGERAGAAVTDREGRYRIEGLAPGEYAVIAIPSGGGLVEKLLGGPACPGGIPLGCRPSSGRPVAVRPSERTLPVDFELVTGGIIAGRVVEQATALPVDAAQITLFAASGAQLDSTATDSQGRYSFDGLEGEYRLTAIKEGWLRELFAETPCGANCSVENGTPVRVTASTSQLQVDFTLDLGSRIEGTVVSAEGVALQDARIQVRAVGSPPSGYYHYPDALGHYSVGLLAPGSYLVIASANDHATAFYGGVACSYAGCWDWSCDVAGATVVEVPYLTTVTGVDITLPRFQWIEGRVVEEGGGGPITGIEIADRDALGCYIGVGVTDTFGHYQTQRVPPGDHRVSTRNALDHFDELFDGIACGNATCPAPPAGSPVALGLSVPTTGVDFSLVRGASISGNVRDALGNSVSLCWSDDLRLYNAGGTEVGWTCSSGTGAYAFRRLLSGTYYARARPDWAYEGEVFDNLPCPWGGVCSVLNGTPILLSAAEQRTGVDFSLDRWHEFRGQVLAYGSLAPVPSASVSARDALGDAIGYTYTNELGEFVMAARPRDSLFLLAYGPELERELFPEVPCPGQVGADCILANGTSVPSPVNEVTAGVTFTLRPVGILGTIRDGVGRPLGGVTVDLFSQVGTRLASVVSDPTGAYWTRWDVGSYLLATDNGVGAVDQLWQGVACPNGPAWLGLCDLALATPVPLRQYETIEGIDFVLSGWPVFKNGFENGSLVGWSGAESQ